MSQDDKIAVLTGKAAPDVDLPPLTWTDGPLGAGGVGSAATGTATALPASIALASAFDPQLAGRYGDVVGQEVRNRGFDGVLGPTVNLIRTPLAGRSFETYGEDPYLTATTATSWIKAVQRAGVMSNVKHLVANDQEGQRGASIVAVEGGRMIDNARVDERTLHEIYMQPFDAAISRAHVAAVMCAYNQVNGTPACAHRELLTTDLRGRLGWSGFVVSDAGACKETAQDVKAGLNFDLAGTCYTATQVKAALATGQITVAELAERVRQSLQALFAHGFFDREAFPTNPSLDTRRENAATAENVAEQGMVLLRNRHGLLPLTRKVRSLVVIGKAAKAYIKGAGSSRVSPARSTTVWDGLVTRATRDHLKISYDDGTNAATAAKAADVAVVVAADNEGEGYDKPCLDLTPFCAGNQPTRPDPASSQYSFGDQDSLIRSVAAANPNTVVVLQTGAPVLTPWRGGIAALLEAWYPGQDGGTAIARVLFGDTDPGGRLPATFPASPADLPTAGSSEQYPGVPDPAAARYDTHYSEGVFMGYRHYDARGIAPAYPFGFGLSYTTFRLSGVRASATGSGSGTDLTMQVKNTGRRSGWITPQAYVALPSTAAVPQPPRQLAAFAKLWVPAGRALTVRMKIAPRAFSYWDIQRHEFRFVPGCARLHVGTSSRDLPISLPAVGESSNCLTTSLQTTSGTRRVSKNAATNLPSTGAAFEITIPSALIVMLVAMGAFRGSSRAAARARGFASAHADD